MNNFIFLKKDESDFIELVSPSLSTESNLNFLIAQLETVFYAQGNQDLSSNEKETKLEELYGEIADFAIVHDATLNTLLTKADLEEALKDKEGIRTDIKISLKKLSESNLTSIIKYLKNQVAILKESKETELNLKGLNKRLDDLRNQDILTNTILFILILVGVLFSYLQQSFVNEDIENLQVRNTRIERSIDAINRESTSTNLKIDKVNSEVKDTKNSIENIVDLKKKEALNNLRFQLEQGVLNESDIAQFILKDKKNKQDN